MCIISLGEVSNIEHIDYKPSRRFSAVGSAYQGLFLERLHPR